MVNFLISIVYLSNTILVVLCRMVMSNCFICIEIMFYSTYFYFTSFAFIFFGFSSMAQAIRPDLEADKILYKGRLVSIPSEEDVAGFQNPIEAEYRFYKDHTVGSFLLGRVDTPLKHAQNKVDLFSLTEARFNSLLPAEIEAERIINYTRFISSHVSASFVTVLNKDKYGDGEVGNVSTSLSYDRNRLYLAFFSDGGVKTDFAGKQDLDILRFVGRYDFSNIEFGVLVQNASGSRESVSYEADSWFFSTKINIGRFDIKAQFSEISELDSVRGKQWSVGLDHHLDSQTNLFTYYSESEDIHVLSTIHKDFYGKQLLKVGLRHTF